MHERIARWYALGLWSAAMVRDAVNKGVITPAQYDAIVAAAP